MSDTTNLNIRIDKELKERAEAFFSELGLNMSSAFTIFVRQALRQGKIPFELSLAHESANSPISVEALRKSIQDAIEGTFLMKTPDSAGGASDDSN